MTLRLLIDECLSPRLTSIANDAGIECTCLRDRGWLGLKDREVVQRAITNDFILVTANSRDFRGQGLGNPGGLYMTA